MADDIFAEFGGRPLSGGEVEQKQPAAQQDIFAEFGGQAVTPPPTQATPQPDPFAEFGGESHYNKLKKEQSAYGFGDLVTEQAANARGGRVLTKTTSNEDINAIASHHKVSPEELRSLAPYYMALPPMGEATIADYAKRAVGAVGYGVLGDIPQFLFKKLQDPSMREALDDVRDLSEGRMGAAEFVGYNLLPTPKIAAGTKLLAPTVKGALAKGAITGAATGLGGSREGEELQAAGLGAVGGAALGATAYGAGKLFKKFSSGDVSPTGGKGDRTVDPKTMELTAEYAKNNEMKIAEVTDQAWSRIEDSEKDIADAAVANKALSDDAVERIISDQLTPDSVLVAKENLAKKLGREVEQITDRDVAEELVRQRREAFAERLTVETPQYGQPVKEGRAERAPTVDEIYARAAGAGEERLVDKFLGEAYVRTGTEQIDKLRIRENPDAAPIGKLLVNSLSDRQFVLKTIDEVKGTNLLPHFYDLITNYNHFTIEKAANDKRVADIFKVARKGDLVQDVTETAGLGGDIFQKMEANRDDELVGPAREVARQLRALWNGVRERANTMTGTGITPLNIAERADFGVPNILVKPVDYVILMKKKMVEVDNDLKAKLGKGLSEILTKEDFNKAMEESRAMRELEGGAKFAYKAPIQDGVTLQEALRDVTQRGASNPRLYNVASTTLKREEKIPDFLREKNLFQITKRYSENTLRSVYMREPLEKLTNQARLLRKAGADTDAAYVERLVADNLGIRAHSMARVGNEIRIKFAEAVDNQLARVIPDPAKRKEYVDSIRLIPELMANVQYNIYPNVLGMNPRAHLAQLTQTWFKNAPEIGGKYGYELTAKSFLQGVLTLRNSAGRELLSNTVRKYGLEPESFIRTASEALADEMERKVLYNTGAKAIRTAADIFMKSYGKMDTFNRGVTAFMAERLVADLNSGVKGAFDAVNKMPISVKRQLVKSKGNLEEQAAIIAKHLNSTTQFNYNRPAMSELGIIAGPFFSTFTKWPLATAGDIVADLRTKGFQSGGLRAVEKYGVTLVLASVMDNAIRLGVGGELDIGGDFKDYDERLRKTLGTGGFVTMTPLSSAASLVPGAREKSLFTPPVVDAFYNGLLQPLMTGDTEKMAEAGSKLVKTFVPGGFVYRYITEDIPIIMTGEKPE